MQNRNDVEEKTHSNGASSRRRMYRRQKGETISFRLRDEELSVLSKRAAIHNASVHRYSRALVLEALLQSAGFEEVGNAIATLKQELNKLREDLAFSMKTLLITAGKVPEKEAVEWVTRNFKP